MLNPEHLLFIGKTGSGKTSGVIRLILNELFPEPRIACAFVYDWNNRWPKHFHERIERMPFKVCFTEADCNAALGSRLVIYNPARMFPGAGIDRKIGREGLDWFCKWCRAVSQTGQGRKRFCIAELWNFCTKDSIPMPLALLANDGRGDEVSLVTDTQHPHLVNSSILGGLTEVICFRVDEHEALAAVKKLRIDPSAAERLPLGSFVARNVLTGDVKHGRIF